MIEFRIYYIHFVTYGLSEFNTDDWVWIYYICFVTYGLSEYLTILDKLKGFYLWLKAKGL